MENNIPVIPDGHAMCVMCNTVFKTEEVSVPAPKGGAVIYFICPHCGQKYQVAIITKRGLILKDLIEAALRRGDSKEHKRLVREFMGKNYMFLGGIPELAEGVETVAEGVPEQRE